MTTSPSRASRRGGSRARGDIHSLRSAPRSHLFYTPPQSASSIPYSGRIRTRVRANEAMRDDETTRTSAHVVVESPSRTQCSEPVVCVSYTSIRTHGTALVRSRAFRRRRRAGTRPTRRVRARHSTRRVARSTDDRASTSADVTGARRRTRVRFDGARERVADVRRGEKE
jgi:hypothetical protein